MDPSTAIAAGILGGGLAFLLIIAAVVWVLLIIAHWRMFTKAGEAGWKSLIPFYSDYTLFKLVWKTKFFWIYIGLIFLVGITNSMGPGYAVSADGSSIVAAGPSNIFVDFLGMVGYFGVTIVYIALNAMTAIAYGKGMVYAFGLAVFPNIFTLILAFGDAEYRGPAN